MKQSRLVYSTGSSNRCPSCGKALGKCRCQAAAATAPAPTAGAVRIQRQSKGRAGKTVTVISGLPLDQVQLQKLLKQLKTHCGAGGKAGAGLLELQGDQRQQAQRFLASQGIEAKLSGG